MAYVLAESAAERLNVDAAALVETLQVTNTLGPLSTSVGILGNRLDEKRDDLKGKRRADDPEAQPEDADQSNGDSVPLRAASEASAPAIETLQDAGDNGDN